jgi:sugar/nucleoside kinase (ribokinase family)
VHFETRPAQDGPTTARCMILVTPDAERTMNTYLGACLGLGPKDMDRATIEGSAITYMEGYLWDPPAAKAAFREAAGIAHAAGRKVALTLSDSFCVDRWRAEFLELMRTKTVDIVFANTAEVKALYQTADFATALDALRADVKLGVVTRSELGSVVVEGQTTVEAPAFPVERLVDTTGAGDLFAAGFLAGHARGADHAVSARMGALAAAEIISHVGARPLQNLAALAAANGLQP